MDSRYGPGAAFPRALALVGAVKALLDTDPEVELATTAAHERGAAARGHIAALLGVEGGHAIENSLAKLDSLYRLGARYLTLTWTNGNDWAGSSTDPERHGGLTSFGRRVVQRMNELGMLIDVSHVSDATFWDVIATTTRPVIASHSSCRALARHPRNLSDAQLKAIAQNGGVVGINFYPVFLDEHFWHQYDELRRRLGPELDSIRSRHRGRPGESAFEIDKFVGERAQSLDVPTLDRLLDHIDHAVQVMGIDHVALGSDFDGISVLPRPLKDVTSLPELVRALGARGYSDGDVRKILGENFLRVLTSGP